MSTTHPPAPSAADTQLPHLTYATVEVEYWTVEMDSDSCAACDTTLVALQDAQEVVHGVAERLGLRVVIAERSIRTWDQALDHSIAASPTIRSEGVELRPEHDGISEARTWRWRGGTSPAPSLGQLVEFLLGALASRSRRLDGYLQAGSASPYLSQYLQPTSLDVPDDAAQPASACCG